MQLDTVAETWQDLAATAARGSKVTRLAELISQTTTPDETATVVSWLSGELTQRQIGIGWAALREVPPPASEPSLTVLAVEDLFERIGATSGTGSAARRRDLIAELFGPATEREQAFLRRLLGGELRQGALIGVMTDAIAKASQIPLADIRRAAMLSGDLAAVAATAVHEGAEPLAELRLQVGRPVGPMLAQTAAGTDEALATLGTAGLEWKLDGVRVQIHRAGSRVQIFTRSLDDVTARLPDVVTTILDLSADELVADGEVIALRPDGRPRPFQVTAARLGSRKPSETMTELTTFLFDLLLIDDIDLLDAPGADRVRALHELVGDDGPIRRTPRLVTDDPQQAQAFLADAIDHGHEGVVAKALDTPYQAGRRGAGWLKIKPVLTLDLVVLAVEWGSGRRVGTLSNIHLGARDPDGGFVMLGKTFKGMTDEMLRWQTDRFLSIAEGPTNGGVVRVHPEQVVEIAFDGVQTSKRYPGGVALRFARVLRYRDDKSAAEADTIDDVRAIRDRGLDSAP